MMNLGFSKLVDNGRAHEAAVAHHENFRRFVRGEGPVRTIKFKKFQFMIYRYVFDEVWFLSCKSQIVDLRFF